MHGGASVPDSRSVELIVGDVGDADSPDHALAGVDRVVHLAAAVGVGQSMYEIERYTELNTMATARFLERVVAQRPTATATRRRVLDVDLRRGRVRVRGITAASPGPRPEEQLSRAMGAGLPTVRRELARPCRPAKRSRCSRPRSMRSTSAITRRCAWSPGAAYGIPTVALRFFNVYGPGQALSNPYTGVAAIFASRLLNGRPPTIFEDGDQSRDFTHVSDIVQGYCRLSSPSRPPGTQSILVPADRPRSPASPRSSRRASGPTSSRSGMASTGRATFATATPTSRGRASCSDSTRASLRGRHGRPRRVAPGPAGDRPRRPMPPASLPPAG